MKEEGYFEGITGKRGVKIFSGKIIASCLLVITLFTMGYFLLQQQNFSAPVNIITSDSGRRIVLPDSSQVTMSTNSEITYPRQPRRNNREVYLKGEAFFEVAHNETKPFIVHTDQGDVRAVGTAFNVDVSEAVFKVSVAEGRVLVTVKADSVFMGAGNEGELENGSETFQIKEISDENEWAYATHKFVFKKTKLRNVFKSIIKSTDYTIEMQHESIGKCELTATFEHLTTEEMLNLIAESMDLTIVKNEHVFTIHGEGCP